MNFIFFAIVLIAFLFGGWNQISWIPSEGEISPMELLSKAMVESAAGSVDLAIGLVGVMTLFLGLMKVAEAGGMLTILARLIRPLMVRLFPDVPPEHPAMGAMILNLSANALGLGNAATPFGIRAVQELNKLNTKNGVATDAMALFLAINTSSVTLLPTGVIALRAALGSSDPAGILPTTLFATAGSTIIAVIAAKLYSKITPFSKSISSSGSETTVRSTSQPSDFSDVENAGSPYPVWVSFFALAALLGLIPLTVLYGRAISPWILPLLMIGFLGFGAIRRVSVYEVFVDGAKEGFQVALRIIPYLVAILVAVGMFRASGAMAAMVGWIGRWTGRIGLPAEALPMALMRPLSGSGAYGIMASILKDPAIGPDSYTGYLVSTLQGSTETTFYVLAVYYGAIQIKRIRHTLAAGLTADVSGLIFAIIACLWLYG
jgi:spore maturation protein SpmA/spore maturation protein SpmB